MDGDTMDEYDAFLRRKSVAADRAGFQAEVDRGALWDWQATVVEWACDLGRAALFADTGLGKTAMQLRWAREVCDHTGGRVLILAPLAVGAQTVREAGKFGVDGVEQDRDGTGKAPITVANYELLHRFDPGAFVGAVLDESSILKSWTGTTRARLTEAFSETPYRLACTATPAPNDHIELGNHSEFLGVMPAVNMLARWFVNDSGRTGQWRLKGHAVESFWDWVASWARCVGLPSDLGDYSDAGYILPDLNLTLDIVKTNLVDGRDDGQLFRIADAAATSLHAERRRTSEDRAHKVAALVNAEPDEPWLIWVETDYDAQAVKAALPDVTEVRGSHPLATKEERLMAFSDGSVRRLLTKPKIAGHGLNWQHCARMAFAGPNYSYEQLYQAIRRCWRFGQSRPVDVHVVLAETELAVWQALERKRDGHEDMKEAMFAASRRAAAQRAKRIDYHPVPCRLPAWLVSDTTQRRTA